MTNTQTMPEKEAAAPPQATPDATATPPRGQGGDLRVVILNQYYVPDVASTGHLLHELAEELTRLGASVRVTTSMPSYGPPESWQPAARREIDNGVRVTRMRTTRFSKDRLAGRLINSVTFLVPLTLRVLFRRNRGEVFLYTTNPPYLGIIGAMVSLFRRHRYVVLLHDSYPQLATWVGKLRPGGLLEKIWHRMNRWIYGRAEQTIVLCEAAKRLVCDTYDVEEKLVHVVPNWADRDKLQVRAKQDSNFAREHGLIEPFTIMYSGNLGLYYEFDTILNAAKRLEGEPFRLVFVGAGGRREYIRKRIAELGLGNTLLLPYQPFETLNDSLSACDASLVTIAEGIEGISFPSKLYSSLATGRPIVALSEEWSELRSVVQDHEVGRWVALGDDEGLARIIREMMAAPDRCAEMGRNARALFERKYTVEASAKRYKDVLELASPHVDTRTTPRDD